MNEKLDSRKKDELYKAFINADSVVMKKHLYSIAVNPICDLPNKIKNIEVGSNFQLSRIERIVYDKDENILDKLTSVYNVMSTYENGTVIMLLHSDGIAAELYLGIVCREIDEQSKCNAILRGKQNKTLKSTILGNFPGTELIDVMIESNGYDNSMVNNKDIIEKLFKRKNAVASVSGIAALRNVDNNKNIEYIQGLEKFVDSMSGKKYSVIFIADNISVGEIENICISYEDLYSQLSPFAKSEQTINTGGSVADTDSLIKGITDTTNDSVSKSLSHGVTKGTSKSHTLGGSVSGTLGTPYVGSATVGTNFSGTKGTNEGTSRTSTETNTIGTAKSLTEQNSVAKTLTSSTGESLQISYDNRAVRTLLERIDEQIKRLRTCEDFGVFDFGAYFMASDTPTAISAASTYKSLMRGENSSVEASAVNVWEDKKAEKVFDYLNKMYHPLIAIPNVAEENSFHTVTPTSLVSGRELPIHIGFPKKSISGLPVIECAEFGRDVVSFDKEYEGDLDIGCIYHMHHEEKEKRVSLSAQSLTAHTFITGSTGAGKSNTIYKILDEVLKFGYTDEDEQVHFLVIEPAKGEYKNVFGHQEDVTVYGTNPKFAEMLRINPFKFPQGIHVLEHLDRLIEIFNVCWPMYAAMPAILKDAIERSYTEAGWDLRSSINKYNENLYPSFSDVLTNIQLVVNESEYSADNKGDYIGALATRVRSLTNGINGMIFVQDDIKNHDLFDKNVIVDLSRIGSIETKALIMGLLVMKLQEYRMSSGIENNSKLRHITVLEEAHNLLKRTSTEQSADSSNLLGKSVEMLANAIAEMRTYGEGFIIADQSPGMLDMSVIRNTNTKIILRLPDFSDRELVGKAAGLNDSQIIELSKLQKGVAAIYQNDWINPIISKIDYYETGEEPYVRSNQYNYDDSAAKKSVLDLIMKRELIQEKDQVDIEKLRRSVIDSSLSTKLKGQLMDYLDSESKDKLKKIQMLAFEFFNSKDAIEIAETADNIDKWKEMMISLIVPTLQGYTQQQIDLALALIIHEQAIREPRYNDLFMRYMETYEMKDGVR